MSMNAIELLRLCRTAINCAPNVTLLGHSTNLKNTREILVHLDEYLTAHPNGEPSSPKVDPYDALCLWEEYLDQPDQYPNITAFREDQGTSTTRELILSWVEPMSMVFAAAVEEGWESCFDFEFVPLFLKHCTNATSDDPSQELALLVNPGYYVQMGRYLALLDKASQMSAMTMQSIRKVNGTGNAPAISVSDIKRWADL